MEDSKGTLGEVIRVERPVEREIRIEVPPDFKLSEEELNKIAAATENQLVDVISGAQAKQLAAPKVVQEVAVGKAKVKAVIVE